LDLWQIEEEMGSGLDDGLFLASVAEIVDQLSRGVEQFLAFLALITSCLKVVTVRTDSRN